MIRAARQRRRTKLSGLGSSALAILVGLALVGTSAPWQERRVDRITTVPSSPTPVTSATAAPDPSPAVEPSVSPTHSPPLVPRTTPSPGETEPRPTDPQAAERPASPISRSEAGSLAATDLCQDGTSAGSSWCLRLSAPDEVHRGTTVRLGITVCLLQTAQSTTVEFPSSREVDVSVTRSEDDVVWQAGEGTPVTEPGGSLAFEPGQCYRWTAPWDTRDREGFLLPPGDYGFGGGFNAGGAATGTGTMITVVD